MGMDDHGSAGVHCHVLVLGDVTPEMGLGAVYFFSDFSGALPATLVHISMAD
jgi:hypothetical protein